MSPSAPDRKADRSASPAPGGPARAGADPRPPDPAVPDGATPGPAGMASDAPDPAAGPPAAPLACRGVPEGGTAAPTADQTGVQRGGQGRAEPGGQKRTEAGRKTQPTTDAPVGGRAGSRAGARTGGQPGGQAGGRTAAGPRSLRDPAVVARRREMLGAARMAPLCDHVAQLRAEGLGEVPDFDPLDGGAEAQILFLLDRPGAMSVVANGRARPGSGFLSRDNDDPTSAAIARFLDEAGILRERSILGCLCPWWTPAARPDSALRPAAHGQLARLLGVLGQLRLVIALGQAAARARPVVLARGIGFRASAHPAPANRARAGEGWQAIPVEWARAARLYAPAAARSRPGPNLILPRR